MVNEGLHIEQLTTKIGVNRILHSGISFSVEHGKMIGIIGPNGCGKSTFLKSMCGLLPVELGDITLKGKSIIYLSRSDRAKLISFSSAFFNQMLSLSFYEFISSGRIPYAGFFGQQDGQTKLMTHKYAKLCGVEAFLSQQMAMASDGEKQKAVLARALNQETPVMCFDEPTNFLDFPSRIQLYELLGEICCLEERIVFISSHDLELQKRFCDGILYLGPNGNWLFGKPEEIFNHTDVQKLLRTDLL